MQRCEDALHRLVCGLPCATFCDTVLVTWRPSPAPRPRQSLPLRCATTVAKPPRISGYRVHQGDRLSGSRSMCWNVEVSLAFGLLGLVCAAFLFFVGTIAEPARPPTQSLWLQKHQAVWLQKHCTPAAKWHALIVANIAAVELCEGVVWLSGPPPYAGSTQGPCPKLNAITTHALFVFGFMNWVWLMPLWGLKTSSGDRSSYKLLLLAGVVSAIGFTARIILGGLSAWPDARSADAALGVDFWDSTPRFTYNASLPVSTCSFRTLGKYPHLTWRFATSEQPWLPNGFLWLLMAILPLLCYQPRDLAAVLSAWGVLTFVLPTILLTPGEAMSLYCWLGFGFEIIFILQPFLRATVAGRSSRSKSPAVRRVRRRS